MHISQMIHNIRLDRKSATALYRQLYEAIRQAILGGAISPGMQLPPSREFCRALGISRQTVLNAYEQLLAEGYLRGSVGQGTFVNQELPAALRAARPRSNSAGAAGNSARLISVRGRRYAAPSGQTRFHQGATRAFRVSMPGLDLFPFDTWARLEARRWRHPAGQLGYGDPAGYQPLRELLAVYLKAARGVNCASEQIIITSGSQQALYLLATILLDPGDAAWLESPCYRGASAPFQAAQAEICAVPVDDEGLDVAFGAHHFPQAKLAYVTPSHQMPLGMTMSLQRRMALLTWAQKNSAWVIEDDYDSEYRFSGAPLASLQSLDQHGCVIYVGTLSKVLFPGLRLGYLVAPPDLVEPLVQAKSLIDKHTAIVPQMVLADFMAEGHFGRHIKRTRKVYGERQAALLHALESQLAQQLVCGSCDTGLDLAVHFRRHTDEDAVVLAGLQAGLELRGLSHYALPQKKSVRKPAPGLLLGFSSLSVAEIEQGVRVLQRVLRQVSKKTGPA